MVEKGKCIKLTADLGIKIMAVLVMNKVSP